MEGLGRVVLRVNGCLKDTLSVCEVCKSLSVLFLCVYVSV